MFSNINIINKLNNLSFGLLGFFEFDESVFQIQMSKNAMLLAAISLLLAVATIVIRKIVVYKTLNAQGAKSKNGKHLKSGDRKCL
jgi:hypothetical protein